jgi:multidrug efflux system outer membrane protein
MATFLTWIAMIAATLLVTGCGGAEQSAQAQPGPPAFPVTAVEAKPKSVPIFQEFIGSTFALNTVQVNSRVNGYIEKWLFRPGDFVAEGQLLYTIDPRTYRAEVQRAQAELARAEAQVQFAREGVEVLRAESELAQAQASLVKADQDVARVRPLVQERALPEQDMDAATANQRVASSNYRAREANVNQFQLSQKTNIQQAEAAVQAAKAALQLAELNLSFTEIKAPKLPVPDGFRNGLVENAKSMGDLQWAELFQDATLRRLVTEALQNNYDLRIAAQNITEARAQVDVARSGQFPVVSGRGAITNLEFATGGGTPTLPGVQREVTFGNSLLDMTFQLDFWGRYRRLTEAARNEFLAQEDARRTVIVSLVADVATTYFQLIELDRELEVSRQTLASRQESLRLVRARESRGVASNLDVSQAENLVFSASSRVPVLERQANILENALSILLARNPGAIADRGTLVAQQVPSELPAGMPGELLQRRPDLQQAESLLRAANARIGVATAALFPQFSLTGTAGFESLTLNRFISDRTAQYSVGPGFAVPIFNTGALRANVRGAKARAEAAATGYERSFQNALRETSDALVSLQKVREQRVEQEQLLRAVREANRLSRLLYEGGVASYLQVLDSDRNLFDAELVLAQIQRDELLAVVKLYRALGGGWR